MQSVLGHSQAVRHQTLNLAFPWFESKYPSHRKSSRSDERLFLYRFSDLMCTCWLDHLFVSSFIADRIAEGQASWYSSAQRWRSIDIWSCQSRAAFFRLPAFLFIQKTRDSSLHRDHSFFRVKTMPMTATAKMIGAVLTNSHSNVWYATLRTAVSGSWRFQLR